MALSSGTRLGPYEIRDPVGAGGMGEVYRARDSRLDRDVAIKVLPEHLAQRPESLARFQKEAKVVAALSHPNILAIHDFGTEGGVTYTGLCRTEEIILEKSWMNPLDRAAHGVISPRTRKLGPRKSRALSTPALGRVP